MPVQRFNLNISAEEYLRYYKGVARKVLAVSTQGQRVAFPAERLRPFVTRDGVRGVFELRYDAQNKFVSLEKVAELPPR